MLHGKKQLMELTIQYDAYLCENYTCIFNKEKLWNNIRGSVNSAFSEAYYFLIIGIF